MLTRLVRQCCKQVAGQGSKPPLLPLLNLHFPLSSAFLSPLSPNEKKREKNYFNDSTAQIQKCVKWNFRDCALHAEDNPPPPPQLHASQAVHQSPQQGAPPLLSL